MMMRFVSILFLFLPICAWGQTEKLIGKNIQDHDLQVFIKNLGQHSALLSSELQYVYPSKGVKLAFYARTQLDAIELYNNKIKQDIYQRYIGKLPFNLSFEMNRKQVIILLGKADFFTNDYLQYNKQEVTLMIYADEKQISKILLKRRSCIMGDCLDGYGIFLSRTGERYEGNWKQGTKHGRGVCYYTNGDKYEGQWLENQLNGEGKMTAKDGTVKNGLWEKGKFKGEIKNKEALLYSLLGKHKTNSSVQLLTETYGGGFKEIRMNQDYTSYIFDNQKLTLVFDEYGYVNKINLKNSGLHEFSGSITSALPAISDEKYIRYALGEPREIVKGENGNIYVYQDGESWVYIRFDKKSMLNTVDFKVLGNVSPLIFHKKSTDCKKGSCANGYGELNQAGNFYKGYFKDELFDGQGEIQYYSGGVYKGYFSQGKREGKGKYTWSDKSSYNGEWKNNQKNGSGAMNYANGDKFVGHWQNDMRMGEGTLYRADGKKISGTWEFDELKQSFTFGK
ncbi:MAG: hypothetical protein EAZ08_07265 [Cytophagales bacterium]|nr:MAG: hypothetical protein EAZ08_07265 [Cytophagales bacterium]